MGKPEGKRLLGRPMIKWLENIGMDFQEVGCGCKECIGLAHDRDSWRKLLNEVMNFWVS